MIQRYKAPRFDPARDSLYLVWIRTLPCAICHQWELEIKGYKGMVEAAHVGMRGLSRKCPDRETIPLCVWHHRLGPKAVHVLGRNFWQFWKLDRYQLFADYQRRYTGEKRDAA